MSHNVNGPVWVLAGGLSHERDVSLRSGRRVAEALRTTGHEVVERDVDAQLLTDLREQRPACVVPVLHGEVGESGSLREVLELAGVPYVGSTPAAARVAWNKPIAKQVLTRAGIATPTSLALPSDTFREVGAVPVMEAVVERIGLPLAVKPSSGGSALGFSVVHEAGDLPQAMVACFAYGDTALVERYISGVEVAVPVIEREGQAQALAPVAIRPDGGVYDYTARYTAGTTEFVVPADVLPDVADRCRTAALTAHDTLGLRDLSRTDLIVDDEGTVWFLEANVAPGLTETSLVPLAVEESGLDLGEVIAGLVEAAVARR